MTVDAHALRTRRALLSAAVAAGAAAVATVLGRAQPADAGDGTAVLKGVNNQPVTDLTELIGPSWIFRGWSTGAGPGLEGYSSSGTGIYGKSNDAVGIHGEAARDEGIGVLGSVQGGTGVKGTSNRGVGVLGTSASAAGVRGVSTSGPGVRGISDTDAGVYGKTGSGNEQVAGVVAEGNATGLFAFAGARGVLAFGNGIGVEGRSETTGVLGHTDSYFGVGVHALSDLPGGLALKAQGRVAFNRSGLKTIPVGSSSVVVAVPGGLGANGKVLCTLESNAAGLAIGRIQKVPAGSFTVYLNRVVPAEKIAKVAWFVIG